MPIIDYKRNAKLAEQQFLNNPKVSNKNKELIKKFLIIYDVSPARYAIFLKHIKLVLQETDDISKDMNDRDKINKIFKELRDRLSPSYYSTIVNVSLRYVRWLYDDDNRKPKGFKDIKNISKDKQKRNLSPKDMITWEDAERLMKRTSSIQIKAMLGVMLDGGVRPSEFTDLNYGDVTIKDNFIILEIKGGKTGARNVILFRAVPHLLRWLGNHPSKKRDSPLWLQETHNEGKIIRYQYKAMQERINNLNVLEWDVTHGDKKNGVRYSRKPKKVLIDKPMDFYNWRHSSCVLAKLDNLPLEEACKKYGHSSEYFIKTYGRLTTEDSIKRLSKVYGLTKQKEDIKQNIKCKRCQFINEPAAEICEQCGAALSIEKALKIEHENEDKVKQLVKEQFKELMKEKIKIQASN